ncbi:BON domain-containing protein [Acinetobacter larvae]|uniref:BON domain-containing protein n=1 Tax=Acinetobacter larvae TaxID=1789224 RepID=A0A1B2M156_9GAMM|nr:BON domain-containing protein [Acinetobacter larvae]AOA58891.1 BON domain-containing protein [Acinetobacter larvae]
MFKPIAIALICVASLSGCTSFISGGTGTQPVGTESGVRSLGQVFIDNSIQRTAKINLYKLDTRFKQSRVNINSFHSNVLLTGQVPDEHLKQLAEDNVRSMSDVKTVHNYITVGPQIGYSTIMQDTTVTANTRGLVMKAPVISDSKVLLHTEDGVLYVMGRLNNAEITDLNDVLQKVGNVTKIVTLVDNTQQATAVDVQPQVQTPYAIDPNTNIETAPNAQIQP